MGPGILSSWYVKCNPACCSSHAMHRMGDANVTSRDLTDYLQFVMGLGSVKVRILICLGEWNEELMVIVCVAKTDDAFWS